MSASTARHEIRALLRAHLAAASAYRHLTGRCAVCHRLLRLAMEPGGDGQPTAPAASPAASGAGPDGGDRSEEAAGRPDGRGREGRAPGENPTGGPGKQAPEERAGAERPSPT
ncbi:DUF6274 family protein [Streptomyces sp. NPDC059698]|uniref:DUF6274 family protein n=1 Tax=unclassified Streptomyces TaxID=2593676 RepID=UPI00095D44DC|nr:DUF6274 family protein [Streptomyces sp. CB02366]OKJ38295.1 hypothetical protein AMK24_11685 [Streptomyces sp. CB02366]WSS56354.1 DUF6274 family protein [Streptomyces sp. NBC_01178]